MLHYEARKMYPHIPYCKNKEIFEGKIRILKKNPKNLSWDYALIQSSLFERSYDIHYDAILFKSKTSNLYFGGIFPADMSWELIPAVGGRQDGKEDSVLVKSGYAREAVVTCWPSRG